MPSAPFVKTNVRKSSGRFKAYGQWWEPYVDPASMQLDCIRLGGKWTNKTTGEDCGMGLYHHYRRFQEIVWPDRIWEKGPYKNYWAEKILECWLESTYFGLMGCAASSKSDSLGSIALTDWYAYPHCTTTLVSSTDLKMLELRIWGMIKKYHKSAKKERDWLPGHLIEGKQMILQNPRSEFEEGREFKNSLVGVPCKRGNQWVGLGSYIGIHNKRVRLIADECFPAGTMVDTPSGQKRIEKIVPGDDVICATGRSRVIATSERISKTLIKVVTRSGRIIRCTPEHPVLTQFGWKKACELNVSCYMLSAYEAMSILRSGHPSHFKQQVVSGVSSAKEKMCELRNRVQASREVLNEKSKMLQSILQCEAHAQHGGWRSKEQKTICCQEKIPVGASRLFGNNWENEHRKAMDIGTKGKAFCCDEEYWSLSQNKRWKRNWTNKGRVGIKTNVSVGTDKLRDQNGHEKWKRVSCMLQVRLCVPGNKTFHRSRRNITQQSYQTKQGRKERSFPFGDWVDHVEVQEQSDFGSPTNNQGGYRVYNLQVEDHPSYSVNGFLVHNCNLMAPGFLDSTSNLSKCEDFKMAAPGNPNATTNAHGIICEPATELGGWESGIDQAPGTKTWKTKYPNGICLQLPGPDSPNLKASEHEDVPFPFLITRQQLLDDAKIWGVDDWHYAMFDEAKMPRGQGSHRVITRQECEKHGAMLEPMWRDTNIVKIGALDAAYRGVGGDRCVFTEINFGREVESNPQLVSNNGIISQKSNVPQGRQILAIVDQVTIPIEGGVNSETPEAQIRMFVKKQCENRGIEPHNFFFDSGMRTSLVQELSREWSTDVQSVDCGNEPTDQRVSSEIDKPCKEYYKKLVTELWYSVRLIIISKQFRNLNQDAMWELCAREWKMTSGNRIEIESKDEMRKKTGKSPDLADCLAIACWGARQRGFTISRLQPPKNIWAKKDWRDDLRKKARKIWASGQLEHATA